MKNLKKIVSVVLALVMTFAMSITAFAADDNYSITLNGAKGTGHSYTAYQVFSGDLSDGKLSNIQWGSDINTAENAALITELKATSDFSSLSDDATAADVAEALSASTADAASFAKIIAKYVKDGTGTKSTESASEAGAPVYTINGLNAGYYLVVDDNGSTINPGDAYSDYILRVVENVNVNVKADAPTVDKKVKDTNDSAAGSTSDWQDSADYDIGDDVPFRLKATLGDISAYKSAYKLTFHDTLSSGLTFNADSVTVKFADSTVAADKYTVSTDTTDGCSFEVTIPDVKAIGATSNSQITVEYTAKLNNQAVIGATGNPNEVKLEYSNNPNSDSTGETPKDKVIVFTYQLVVNKVDQNKNPLTGAGFTLQKKNTSGEYVNVGSEIKGTDLTQFTWKGLDDGDYKLVETTTPAGYNTIKPIEFTISATHTDGDEPALTELKATDSLGSVTFTADTAAGTLTTDVENRSGSTLPSTGGIGTTVFYAAGAILIAGAAILLIVKKRRAAQK